VAPERFFYDRIGLWFFKVSTCHVAGTIKQEGCDWNDK